MSELCLAANGHCTECGGSMICKHKTGRNTCRICFLNPEVWCKLCKNVYIKRSPYKPYCFSCYCHLNPDEPIVHRRLSKQHYIHTFIKEAFPDVVYDKRIPGGWFNRRPDWLLDCKTHCIIVECDESDQHRNYSCEAKRELEIFTDLGNRPLVVIRFNPDEYKNGNEKIPGCFTFNAVNRVQPVKDQWEPRFSVLKETIKKYIDKEPTKELTDEFLFYDVIF